MTTIPTQSAIDTAIRSFLTAVLPPGIPIIKGQVNRVAEPSQKNYVVFWPLTRFRLGTNIDNYKDAVFTGSIAGDVLTITAVDPAFTGQLGVGIYIFGVGVTDNTQITALGTGTGGVGTYIVSPSQTVSSSQLAAGTANLMQKTKLHVQCDVHGPESSNNAVAIEIAMWDDIANRFFNPDVSGVAPLYADDPRQSPFVNGENQFEDRWVVDIYVQTNQTVYFSQQFAAAVDVDVISVAAQYPLT